LSRPAIPVDAWDRGPWNRWSFQHVSEFVPTALVHRSRQPAAPLPARPQTLDQIAFEHQGEALTIGGFLDRAHTDGFIVLHHGEIVFERYMNGMTERTRHLSQSVAKSITSTVAGILSARGQFDTQAYVTHYLPELEATAYRGARIQHVLDMASGVAFSEAYTDPDSDVAMLDFADGWKRTGKPGWPRTTWELIMGLTKLERPHGERFNYRSIETDVLAMAMERATGQRLPDLVSSLIWEPMGAEHDAHFTVDPAGYALADGGFNATLRDYARFGLLHATGGVAQGRQIVPHEWIAATQACDPNLIERAGPADTSKWAYKNQFWIENYERRAYMAIGVFGQLIYIDPDADFVAVKLSSWPDFVDPALDVLTLAAVNAIKHALGSDGAGLR
jgi:CubicO group peptidase (beta-lactamase class C family)